MIASALREALSERSLGSTFPRNAMAGITVGIVALPLSMGLAIASGVPPQHGLYTAIIGGIVIALLGGSRVNISGPTAAFVVILLPVVEQYGLGGLLVSGLLAGAIMVGFGLLRLGGLIKVIPYPVVVGFTSGIGVVIAVLQMKDFLGLQPISSGPHFLDKANALVLALPTLRWQELAVGVTTLTALVFWKRFAPGVAKRIPSYLIALVLGAVVGVVFNTLESLPVVDTIATRFNVVVDGVGASGIPAMAPRFILPWHLPGPDGQPVGLSPAMLQTLLGSAFAIALLGALESLMCAVVADGMSSQKHNPDSELIGQGIGNICLAFFGGIPATAAIARTATNIRSGGSTPIAAVVHGLFVLLAMLLLAPLLSLIPMASMAAVLLVVAWNMSEARHAVRIVAKAPRSDAAVFVVCFLLTVMVDMEVAVAAGLALASLLFMRRITELTATSLVDRSRHAHEFSNVDGVVVYDVDGPLFFGAAHKALKIITAVNRDVHTVVLDLTDVRLLDTTAMMNLESIARELANRNTSLYLIHVSPKLVEKMERYGLLNAVNSPRVAKQLSDVPAMAQNRA